MTRRLALLVLLALIVLTGCQARSKVDIDVSANGSGTVAVEVTLDREAAAAVPEIAQKLRTGDLASNGWKVDDPSTASNGDTVVKLHHGFSNVGEANIVMSQLSGSSGVLHDFKLTQQRSLTNVETKFAGTVDLRNGVESFGDDVVRSRTGSALGFDPEEASKALGVNWQQSFPIDVAVHLPGGSRSSAPAAGSDRVWHATYGAEIPLTARASGLNIWPLAMFGLALVFAIGAVAVVILWKSGKYRPQHSRKTGGVRARDLLAQSPEHTEFVDLTGTERMATDEPELVR